MQKYRISHWTSITLSCIHVLLYYLLSWIPKIKKFLHYAQRNFYIRVTAVVSIINKYTVHTKKEMHGRDTTVLIDLLWFNVIHYSSLFQYFFSIYYGPYSSWKLVYLFVNFFCNTIMIMIMM